MIDPNMTNILKGFDQVEKPKARVDAPLTEVQPQKDMVSDSAQQNAMKKLLEGLDSGARKVNQMPGTHVMAKAKTNKTHPAGKHFVGASAEPSVAPSAVQLDEINIDEGGDADPVVGATVTIKQGMKRIKGTITQIARNGQAFKIESPYNFNIVKKDPMGGWRIKDAIERVPVRIGEDVEETSVEETLKPKQSLADMFRSMDEANDDTDKRLEKELYAGIQKAKALTRGENGKHNLADDVVDFDQDREPSHNSPARQNIIKAINQISILISQARTADDLYLIDEELQGLLVQTERKAMRLE